MSTRGRGPHNDGTNLYCKEMDAALEKQPPVIRWRKGKGGVMVPEVVDDPHADTSNGGANRAKTTCKWDHPFDEANTIVKPNGSRECRACKQRHNDARGSALLDAARTGI